MTRQSPRSDRDKPARAPGVPGDRLAEELERRTRELERRAEELEEEIERAAQDWRRKREDPNVPGARPPRDVR